MIPSRHRLLVHDGNGAARIASRDFSTCSIGRAYRTWYIYFGTVRPDIFLSVEAAAEAMRAA
jgi:hypothetical protein